MLILRFCFKTRLYKNFTKGYRISLNCDFSAHVCGEQNYVAEVDHESLLEPPPFPGYYSNYMYCWYKITSPVNTRIRFWIDDLGSKQFYRTEFYLKVN